MKIRCKYYDDDSQNVFSITANLMKNEEIVDSHKYVLLACLPRVNSNIFSFEISFVHDFDCIRFVFEEHFIEYFIDITKNDFYNLGLQNLGVCFTLHSDPNDYPTYAGRYKFMHPLIKANIVPFYTIHPYDEYKDEM